MGRYIKFTKDEVIAAIPGTGGLISHIAKKLGATKPTIYAYMKRWPEVAQAVEDEIASISDKAERVIFDAIISGDITTSKWYLERVRRDRFSHSQR